MRQASPGFTPLETAFKKQGPPLVLHTPKPERQQRACSGDAPTALVESSWGVCKASWFGACSQAMQSLHSQPLRATRPPVPTSPQVKGPGWPKRCLWCMFQSTAACCANERKGPGGGQLMQAVAFGPNSAFSCIDAQLRWAPSGNPAPSTVSWHGSLKELEAVPRAGFYPPPSALNHLGLERESPREAATELLWPASSKVIIKPLAEATAKLNRNKLF